MSCSCDERDIGVTATCSLSSAWKSKSSSSSSCFLSSNCNLKYLTVRLGSDFPATPTDSTTSILFLCVVKRRAAPSAEASRPS
nr:hypothetical protein Iba_chr09bCG6820 [Ipomoea batatas]GMD37214.1 hypothetical protein Iba_chr09eCG7240 [Ipomoea batatas]